MKDEPKWRVDRTVGTIDMSTDEILAMLDKPGGMLFVSTDGLRRPGGFFKITNLREVPAHLRNLPADQQKIVDEKHLLDERRDALLEFFATPLYGEMPDEEKALYVRQSIAMRNYSDVLAARIDQFNGQFTPQSPV